MAQEVYLRSARPQRISHVHALLTRRASKCECYVNLGRRPLASGCLSFTGFIGRLILVCAYVWKQPAFRRNPGNVFQAVRGFQFWTLGASQPFAQLDRVNVQKPRGGGLTSELAPVHPLPQPLATRFLYMDFHAAGMLAYGLPGRKDYFRESERSANCSGAMIYVDE